MRACVLPTGFPSTSSFIRHSAPDKQGSGVLCVRDHIFGTTCPIFTKCCVRVTYGRGSVLLWRRSDTLCTSGFMDDVTFAHKPRLLHVAAQLKRSAHAALGLAVNCVQ